MAVPLEMGLSPPSLVAHRELQSPWVTTLKGFTSNSTTNSQPEALKFNYQGELDVGKGLTLRIWRREHCKLPGAGTWTQAKHYLYVLRSHRLCSARLGWPCHQSPQDILLGTALSSRDCFAISRILGGHMGDPRFRGSGGHRELSTHLGLGWLLLLVPPEHPPAHDQTTGACR